METTVASTYSVIMAYFLLMLFLSTWTNFVCGNVLFENLLGSISSCSVTDRLLYESTAQVELLSRGNTRFSRKGFGMDMSC
jgi:hypothetical protein